LTGVVLTRAVSILTVADLSGAFGAVSKGRVVTGAVLTETIMTGAVLVATILTDTDLT
jgi:uncharacterized protein YjbI with pentapeptide repeats